jgi:cytochrome c biogenesis protein CcdA
VPDAPYALAIGAGLLAAVNPCGFALLPGYVSLVVLGSGEVSRAVALRRALAMTAAMTAGFVGVFGLFGAVVTPLALSVERYLPWVTVLVGIALVGLGGWLLAGRQVYLRLPRPGSARIGTSAWSTAAYGAAYAIASLSCTVGPFLALTTATFRSGSVLGGIGVFVAYALGMGLVVGLVTVATALARQAVVARVRRALPLVARAGGLLLLVAGLYVAYYGWYEIRLFGGGPVGDPVIDGATRVQGELQGWLSDLGAGRVAVALAVLVAAAAGTAAIARRTPRPRLAGGAAGQVSGMEPEDEERVRSRAELLPEERTAGSEDPEAQAEAVLADSDERTEVPDAAPDTVLERRSSGDATDPG